MEYQRHPESEIYPEMEKSEFDLLVKSMRVRGYDSLYPIMLYEGMIVDGWNRYRASNVANVKPVFKHFEGKPAELRDFIMYVNSARRHLTKAQHIQALLKANQTTPASKRLSDEQISRITRASMQLVGEQRRIRLKDEGIADKVASGAIASSVAERTILGRDTHSSYGRLTVTFPTRMTNRIQRRRMYEGEGEVRFVQKAIKYYLDRMDLEDPMPKS